MSFQTDWAGLQCDGEPLPLRVEYERGVWGKVHGAPTDFRWIARSGGFAHDCADLQMQLNLGGEDAPARFVAWRNLADRCFAVTGYASRAIDASGRRGFLEKQILEWRRPPAVPAAIGALLLLPHAAAMTDDVWWERYSGDLWAQPEIFRSLDATEHEPLIVDADHVHDRIERGREQLRETVSEDALAQLYEQLLSARRPSLLSDAHEPLGAEAVAALLLPLPRDLADRLSLTGWIPSTRQSIADLGHRWDVLVTSSAAVTEAPPGEAARQMAAAVLSTIAPPRRSRPEPTVAAPVRAVSLRPGLRIALSEPNPGDDAPILRELYEFAADANRRWLAPDALRRTSPVPKLGSRAAGLIASWITELQRQKPTDADDEQWTLKIDLLRSAAIVLVPDRATLHSIGLPARVPALFYALLFERPEQWDSLAALGPNALRQTITHSVTCDTPRRLSEPLRDALVQWQHATARHDVNVRGLLSAALTP